LIQNVLNFIASEVHPAFGRLFATHLSETLKNWMLMEVAKTLTIIENDMDFSKQYLVGSRPTIADYYLFVVLSWAPGLGIDLSLYPKISSFVKRISDLPNVKAAQERMAENPSETWSAVTADESVKSI
jgi:glutathione S-transferase